MRYYYVEVQIATFTLKAKKAVLTGAEAGSEMKQNSRPLFNNVFLCCQYFYIVVLQAACVSL